MNLELEGKVFFITGAASGIGACATKIFWNQAPKSRHVIVTRLVSRRCITVRPGC